MLATRFYTVQSGDTLGEIAYRNRITVKELCKINGIHDPDRIEAGEVIALSARAVCKVKILLIDWDRNPMANATVRLEYCGKSKTFTSGRSGCIPEIVTETPENIVDVSILRPDRSWEKIARVPSGWGNKLITLRSPKLKLVCKTQPHPKDSSGKALTDSTRPATKASPPPVNPKSTIAEGKAQAEYGDGNGLKTRDTRNAIGLPVTKVTSDQAEIDFLGGFRGDKINENDYSAAAKTLGVEVEVILAIGEMESRQHAFDNLNRPLILYERHWFSRLTKGRYDRCNPDISSRTPYTFDAKDKDSVPVPDVDRYLPVSKVQYAKLSKAYKLDKDAAMMSCSWGKYQIMGFNHKLCGFNSVRNFVVAMCESERRHLEALVQYIEKNCLAAARRKDWRGIAYAYNGPAYWKRKYHVKLERMYFQQIAQRSKG